MTCEDYDAFCGSLPHARRVVECGDASVWKIAGKVFAIGERARVRRQFQMLGASFAILSELAGLRPAPYLASRGLFWVQRVGPRSLGDDV
jgi:predicted DNA-binding protein (MmcQ/YjbR family)